MSSYSINKILFKIKKDRKYRELFLNDFKEAIQGFPLTAEEERALEERNYPALLNLGAKAMLLLPFAGITRPKRSFVAG